MQSINQFEYQEIRDEKLAESICVAAVVRVTKFDPAKMTVNVQPMSKHLENGSYESQPPILGIPVVCTRSGGFIFRPWITEGDIGVVVYLDHDLDDVLASGKEIEPSTERNHSTSDAVYIGGIIAGSFSVKGLPEKSLALAKEDGSIYIAIAEDKIMLKGDLSVDGKITAKGDILAENRVSVAHHIHSGCSGGSTGQPI